MANIQGLMPPPWHPVAILPVETTIVEAGGEAEVKAAS